MPEVIGRFTPQAFALLRIVSGLMFACHGASKLLGWPSSGQGGKMPIASLMGVAGIIELVAGLLIAITQPIRLGDRWFRDERWVGRERRQSSSRSCGDRRAVLGPGSTTKTRFTRSECAESGPVKPPPFAYVRPRSLIDELCGG